jgi:Fe-S cluster biogenesis protein NfuA
MIFYTGGLQIKSLSIARVEALREPKTPEQILEEILFEFQPVFRAHGGGAEVVSAGPEVVILRLKGHCSDCALAPLTFGLGIEKLIRQRLPEVREVRYTN